MPDTELTNYKCGIDVWWGLGDGSDKGSAYMEEYWFFDKLLWDIKTVDILSETQIHFGHNARNVSATTGRTRQIIGANGLDGVANSGDEGQVRFSIDQGNRWLQWGGVASGKWPAYTGPFTLGGLTYDDSTPVVGSTSETGAYWKGILDSAGDEWHVMRYADDDTSIATGFSDAAASDGKYVLLRVNPKTPGLTFRATGSGQFYTTPAWTYQTYKIHDQTTYIRGNGVSVELRAISGQNVSYRINSGNWVHSDASFVTLTEGAFVDGVNFLECYYAGNSSFVRSRKIVKNPTHPSNEENHGDNLWGGAGAWDQFVSRSNRMPYKANIDLAQTADGAGHKTWDLSRRTGWRYGGTAWPSAYRYPATGTNALMARLKGINSRRIGAARTFAEYAKEMLMESPLNQAAVGIENPFWASYAMPCPDVVYRGYWDAGFAFSAAIAYDILVAIYRSDQSDNGITPIEDYFLRDRLAEWCHLAAINLRPGMWSTSRGVAATAITVVMPAYSTPYYGTSGMDGKTAVYSWAPYKVSNYTWKQLFVTHDYTVGQKYEAPGGIFGMEGDVNNGALIRPPGTAAVWVDRPPYTSFSQCGYIICWYANLQAIHAPENDRSSVLNFLNQISVGVLYGDKTTGGEAAGPIRRAFCTVMNARFPSVVSAAREWMKSNSTGDNSEASQVASAGLMSLFFYDDGRDSGITPSVAPSIVAQPASVSALEGQSVQFSIVATGSAPIQYQWRRGADPITGQDSATLSIPAVGLQDSGVYSVIASNSAGSVVSIDVILSVQPAPLNQGWQRFWHDRRGVRT